MEKPKLRLTSDIKMKGDKPTLEQLGVKLKMPKYSLEVAVGSNPTKNAELKLELEL